MSESVLTVDSSVAPSDSPSVKSGRRKRPGKKERQSVQGFPTPSVSTTSSFNAGKQTSFGRSGDPVFQPGKFPVIFDVGVGEPTVDTFFGTNPGEYAKHVDRVFEMLRGDSKFVQYRADAQVLDDTSEITLRREFVAAGLCTLATQITKCHDEMKLPVGDLGPIPVAEAYHVSSVHAIASQYGEFKLPDLGRRYLYSDFGNNVKRVVRLADKVLKGHETERAVDVAWLPVSVGDKSSALVIASHFHDSARRLGVSVPDVEDIASSLFSGEEPGWWEPIVHSQPMWVNFSRLFQRFPDPASFVAAFRNYPPNTTDLSVLLGLRWPNPDVGDLDWGLNVKSAFGDIQIRWSVRRPVLDRYFKLETVGSRGGDLHGSTLQLSSTDEFMGVSILNTIFAAGAPALSLAIAFLPRSWFSNRERLDVRKNTMLTVGQRAVEWVLRDFK